MGVLSGVNPSTLFQVPTTTGTTDTDPSDSIYVITPKDVTDAVEEALKQPPKYATEKPEDYRYARKSFADQYGLNLSDLTWRLNSLADYYLDLFGRYPTGTELFQWDRAQNSVWSFATGFSQFPSTFTIDNPEVGTELYYNDPVLGILPRTTDLTGALELNDLRDTRAYGPAIPMHDLPAILAGLSPAKQPRSGSGSRGGAGRTPRTFDRRQLEEGVTDRWRGLLLEEPTDAEVSKLVSDYISQANAFWMKDSGSLDFDTFIVDRVRATDRHTFLYSKKPEFQSEDEYMGGFRSSVAQFGLNDQAAIRQLEAGASSGAGLGGFTERVSRSREVRAGNQGGFSRQLAGQLSQMGALG